MCGTHNFHSSNKDELDLNPEGETYMGHLGLLETAHPANRALPYLQGTVQAVSSSRHPGGGC